MEKDNEKEAESTNSQNPMQKFSILQLHSLKKERKKKQTSLLYFNKEKEWYKQVIDISTPHM